MKLGYKSEEKESIYHSLKYREISSKENPHTYQKTDIIRQRDTLLSSMLSLSHDFICLTNTDGDIIYANQLMRNLIGISEGETKKRSIFEFLDKDSTDKLSFAIRNLKGGKSIIGLEVNSQSSNGERHEYELNAIPLGDNGSTVTILNIVRDITSHKRAEKEASKWENRHKSIGTVSIPGVDSEVSQHGVVVPDITERKVTDRRDDMGRIKFETVLEHPHDAICMVDSRFRVVSVNKRFAKIFGLSVNEVVGSKCYGIFRGIFCNTANCPLRKLQRGEELTERTTEIELTNGRKIPMVMTAKPLQLDDGQSGVVIYLRDISEHRFYEERLSYLTRKLNNNKESIIRSLLHIAEINDPYLGRHHTNVSQLALTIGKEMNLPLSMLDGIRMAGMVHDIGMVFIPMEIINRAGALIEEEFDIVKTHPRIGYEILKNIDFDSPVADIVLQHHERLNGSGYPEGLKGDDIMIEAKVICVADVIDAMSSNRPHRPILGTEIALNELTEHRGVLYEPEVVDACVKLYREKRFHFEGARTIM